MEETAWLAKGEELLALLVERLEEHGDEHFLPLPLPLHPGWAKSASHRLRSRATQKRCVWRLALRYVEVVNRLSRGDLEHRTAGRQEKVSKSLALAHQRALRFILGEAARHAKERRSCDLTGAQAVAQIIHGTESEVYSGRSARHAQVPLVADLIEEPRDDHAVQMLDVLPPLEAEFYRYERNVLHKVGIAPSCLTSSPSSSSLWAGLCQSIAAT